MSNSLIGYSITMQVPNGWFMFQNGANFYFTNTKRLQIHIACEGFKLRKE